MKLHYASSHAELASDFFFFSLLLLRKIFLFISYMNANKKPAFTDVWCDLNIMQSSRRRRCSFSCSSRHIRESSWVVHVKSPLDRPCISHWKAQSDNNCAVRAYECALALLELLLFHSKLFCSCCVPFLMLMGETSGFGWAFITEGKARELCSHFISHYLSRLSPRPRPPFFK